MVMNPMAFMTPQQQEMLKKVQAISKDISAEIKTSDNEIHVLLSADKPDAVQLLPQIQEGLVNSIANTLYQMFGISGKRV